jgi:hypothetical protein
MNKDIISSEEMFTIFDLFLDELDNIDFDYYMSEFMENVGIGNKSPLSYIFYGFIGGLHIATLKDDEIQECSVARVEHKNSTQDAPSTNNRRDDDQMKQYKAELTDIIDGLDRKDVLECFYAYVTETCKGLGIQRPLHEMTMSKAETYKRKLITFINSIEREDVLEYLYTFSTLRLEGVNLKETQSSTEIEYSGGMA